MTKESGSFKATRRHLLGFGVAGGALAFAFGRGAAQTQSTVTEQPEAADAPISNAAENRQPFYGIHQPGIVTPRPAAGMIAAFNVVAQKPEDIERLFKVLTERIAFLMQGGTPPELDPKLPPADSGILGPVVSPDNLTITVSLGSSFFENRDWLRSQKPARLQRMTSFPNDALDRDLCHGDLALQFCANTVDTNIHALRDILKNLSDLLVLRWKQEGTVPVIRPRADGKTESARNLLGFRDGSANPDSNDLVAMDKIVWVGSHSGEPEWTQGGTYQAIRIIRNFVERWDRTPLGEQQHIFGRMKMTGAPMGGATEHDAPDFERDPDGQVTRLNSHIRLANDRTPAAQENLILRRPFNYSNGVTKSGQLDQGLLFICYQADLEKGFIAVQTKLNGEPLEEYIKPIGGGYFFVLPGVTDAGDYLGRRLLEAARSS